MFVYEIQKDVKRKAYQNFIHYAIEHSDAFMLVEYKSSEKTGKSYYQTFEELEKFQIKERGKENNIWKWPNMEAMYDELRAEYCEPYDYIIRMYRADMAVEKVLQKPKSLFNWNWPDYPMDLSFFKEGVCWFATTAHEKNAYIYTDSNDLLQDLKQLGLSFEKESYDSDLFVEEYTI